MSEVTPLRLPRFRAKRSLRRDRPPGSGVRYPGQFMVEIARNPLAMMVAMKEMHGDIAHWRIGPQNLYLFSHPDVNWFFTSLEGQPREDIRDDVRTYLDANPQTKADLTGIRQPLVDLKNRCGNTPDVP